MLDTAAVSSQCFEKPLLTHYCMYLLCLDQSSSLDTQRLSHCNIIIYEGQFRKSFFIFMRTVELRTARVPGLTVDDTL